MSEEEHQVLLTKLIKHNKEWVADMAYNSKQYTIKICCDQKGRWFAAGVGAARFTVEAREICRIVQNLEDKGVVMPAIPTVIVPKPPGALHPSIRDEEYWEFARKEEATSPKQAIVLGVDEISPEIWLANLKLDELEDHFEIRFHTDEALEVTRFPKVASIASFQYDLEQVILAVKAGRLINFPFSLRPRWPTPPPP